MQEKFMPITAQNLTRISVLFLLVFANLVLKNEE